MNNKPLLASIYLLVFVMIFSACSSALTPEAASVEAQPVIEATSPTEAPVPTEAPLPLPCTIAFESDRDGNKEIYVMDPDGSNPRNLTNNSGDDIDPAWSADGSQIAFASSRENGLDGGQFIYVMNADGSNTRQLSLENESKWPDWSPDGSRITYTNKGDIYIMNADGSGQSVNLTNSPEEDQQSSWSPDGSQIAWLSGNDGNWNILVMNAEGGNKQQLTDDGKVTDVQWTVGGQLFTHWDNQAAGCFNCVMDADGSNIAYAGGKGEIQRYLPFWTWDGLRVECVSGDLNGSDNEIYLVGEEFPDIFLNLTNNPANDVNPDWPANCGPGSDAAVVDVEVEQPKDSDQMVIGYENSGNNMSKQEETDLLKACNELQIECIGSDSISKLAEQNVDAIISFSNRWHVMGSWPAFHDVIEKGILLIVLNAETGEPGAYNLSIESDSVQKSLEWMFKEMGETGEFVYYNFGKSDFHQALIDQALKKHPGIKATSMPADYEGNSLTEESIAEAAASNPNLGAIWTNEWTNNVFWGLKNSHVVTPPAILCEPKQDMLQFWKEWISENPSFRCFSTIKPGGIAYEGVYTAYYILSGEEIDPAALGGESGNTFIYDYPIITNDNLDEWLGKIGSLNIGDWGNPEMPTMTPEEIKEKWFLD